MFSRVLVANRGEIAVRIIRACRELDISPAVVYSEADRESLHVQLADQAVCIGPAPSSDSYLRIDRILEAARRCLVDAIHPGYGFLAENAEFAQACVDSGFVFVGPSATSIRLMGSKIASRQAMVQAGVPVVPGTEAPGAAAESAAIAAREIGFPVIIKASAGGGGKGMRIVKQEKDFRSAWETARGEAASAFGDPTLYLEKYLTYSRHIEIQVLGDQYGNLVHLGERECSIQRRHQKLVEECPSPAVDPALRRRLGEAALAAARAAGYYNAGTVEFLVGAEHSSGHPHFYFLEMNTRLQVEHPVTEMVTGIDLVCEQLRVAAGSRLSFAQQEVRLQGAAIECRIYAEDPGQEFFPSPGLLTTLREPAGPGVRTDSGVYAGFVIPVNYDPLISKLITHGNSRGQAISRMRRALAEYRVGGVRTTIPFFHRLLSHPDFLDGRLHTRFIEEHDLLSELSAGSGDDPIIPLAAAGLYEFLEREPLKTSRAAPQSRWKEWVRPVPAPRRWRR